jgi:hypothetical protein
MRQILKKMRQFFENKLNYMTILLFCINKEGRILYN